MKVRTVEYQLDPHRPNSRTALKTGTSVELSEYDNPLDYEDPGVTDDWEPLHGTHPPVRVRSRMFFGVESVTHVSPEYGPDSTTPGKAHELRFSDGETITVHNAVIAESHVESETPHPSNS